MTGMGRPKKGGGKTFGIWLLVTLGALFLFMLTAPFVHAEKYRCDQLEPEFVYRIGACPRPVVKPRTMKRVYHPRRAAPGNHPERKNHVS